MPMHSAVSWSDGLDGARLLGAQPPHRPSPSPSITSTTAGAIIADHPELARRCITVLRRNHSQPQQELRELLVAHARHLAGVPAGDVFTSLTRKLEQDAGWTRTVDDMRRRHEERLRSRTEQEERDRRERTRNERRRVTLRLPERRPGVDALIASMTWDVRRCLRVLRKTHLEPEAELRRLLNHMLRHSRRELDVVLRGLAEGLEDEGLAGTDVARTLHENDPIHPRRHPRPDWHDRLR